jgi:putative ABC transport system ATP-binding protein
LTDQRQTVLSLEEVTKIYGEGERAVRALDNVTMYARAGELIVIMGPSGSGKTTLLTIAGALLKPTRGTVTVCGVDISQMSEGNLASIRRENVGFVYQSFNLLESLTALENVQLVTTNGAVPKARARELLEMLGLGHRLNSLPKTLSDGEKQRVAIARALAKDPALILADEPTANLDANRGREVMRLLREKAVQSHRAVVVVSHDHRIRDVADSVLWLEDGRMHTDGDLSH